MAKRRPSGDGMVRKKEDGSWEGRVVIGYDEKNLPKTKNVLAKTKSECVEKLKQLQEQYAPPKSDKIKLEMPFGEWMDFWYQNYSKPKLRPTTRSGYEGRIYRHIISELGNIPLDQLTQNDLQQFYARLKKSGRLLHAEHYGKGLSDRMVRACHMNCRSALEKAVQEGLIRMNPAVGCKLPPKKAREMQVLTREEIQRFLIHAKAEGYFELFLLELTTGLRRGELLALQWDDLNLETGELQVTKQVYRTKEDGLLISKPKTKSSIRTVSLPPTLLNILKEYKESVNSRWMFPAPVKEDSPLDPAYIRTRLHLILEHAQCKLVRDQIPEIIKADGKICICETLSDKDYIYLLDQKLNEELAEYQESKSLEELADLLEVMQAVVKARGWTLEELEQVRADKAAKRGGFEKKILLKGVKEDC